LLLNRGGDGKSSIFDARQQARIKIKISETH
jgi:hypothetical protein